jgi:hypothetical protein
VKDITKKSSFFPWEHLLFILYIVFLYLVLESDWISRVSWARAHLYWNIIVFILLLLSINVRILVSQRQEKRFITSFTFGFIFGAYQWMVFALTEFYSLGYQETFLNIVSLTVGIIGAGLVMGLIASVIALFLYRIISYF